MQLNFTHPDVSAHVGIEYRVAYNSGFIQNVPNVTLVPGNLIQAQLDASARTLGFPIFGTFTNNVE
jgi:hypothetical protein